MTNYSERKNQTNSDDYLHTESTGTRTPRQFDTDQRVIEEAVFEPEAKQALQITRYEYDAAGQLTVVIDGLGRSTRFEYDADGRRIRTLNPDQSERRYVYNARGQLVEETDEAGATSKRSYDAFGNMVAFTDAEGNTLQTLFEAPAGSAVSMAAARRPTGIQQARE